MKKADVFVFLDFPDTQTHQIVWQQIVKIVQDIKIPIFLFSGKFLSKEKLQGLEPVLSFQFNRNRKEINVLPVIAQAGEGHPILKISEIEKENKKIWEQLPPIYTSWVPLKSLPENWILLTAAPEKKLFSSQEALPLLIARQTGGQNILIFTGYDFYRWNLLIRDNQQNEKVMDHFLGQSIRWLSTPKAGKTVHLVLPKMVYNIS